MLVYSPSHILEQEGIPGIKVIVTPPSLEGVGNFTDDSVLPVVESVHSSQTNPEYLRNRADQEYSNHLRDLHATDAKLRADPNNPQLLEMRARINNLALASMSTLERFGTVY